ncbi:MAG: hypothetical protein ACI8QQ_003203 [Psychroserpens sp.]|jgi:hypothetical protein
MSVNRYEIIYYDTVLFKYTNCKIKQFTLHKDDINLKIVQRYFISASALYSDKFLEMIYLKFEKNVKKVSFLNKVKKQK